MLVYAIKESPRLQYILDFIGKEIFDQDVQLTTDRQQYQNYAGPKINYSSVSLTDSEFWIDNTDLLFEEEIKPQHVKCIDFNGNKAFFATGHGDLPFDIFAASFYLLSRYEEYLPHTKDKYGRYAHVNAIAYQQSFLHLPMINIWLNEFKKALLKKFPNYQFKQQVFKCQPTYDIDIAWSYKNKGWLRNTGGLVKSILQGNLYAAKERVYVLLKKKSDPFDSYQWLHDLHHSLHIEPVYFFLMASRQKGFDKNISPLNKDLEQLIKEHDRLYSTGIHPSWQSGDNEKILGTEIKSLEELVGHDIVYSRQHYIRFNLPTTYRKLIHHEIKKDYSMGYGTINGFRASVASSFYWYDLEKETATDLLIYPFCFMDANAYYELKLSPQLALKELESFYNIIKEVNGLMITIFHNNFLGTDRKFAGWREVYSDFIKMMAGDIEDDSISQLPNA